MNDFATPATCCWCDGDIYLAFSWTAQPGTTAWNPTEAWYHYRQGYYMRSLRCPITHNTTHRRVHIDEDPIP